MKKKNYIIYNEGEYKNPLKGEFTPNIMAYLHEDEDVRAAFVVVPGGGYRGEAITEGEFIAKKFYDKGYNAFVLSYTNLVYEDTRLMKMPLADISRAITYVRKNADKFHIDTEKVSVCGFSAGGHLCGSIAVHYNDPEIRPIGEYEGISNKPNAVILSYPVITSGEFAHKDSICALVGDNPTKDELDYFSLENHVTKDTPPTYIWHTSTDELVPVENSYLFAQACQKNKVAYELHIYYKGAHGYSLANEQWATNDIDINGDYIMNQWFSCMQYYIDNELAFPEVMGGMKMPKGTDYRQVWRENEMNAVYEREANLEVAMWPDMVDKWLKDIYNR